MNRKNNFDHLFDSKMKSPKPMKPEKCSECDKSLIISKTRKGQGYCEECARVTAIPIGKVANSGPHRGKLVYLRSAIMAEESQDAADYMDAQLEVRDELRVRKYFIIDLFEEG